MLEGYSDPDADHFALEILETNDEELLERFGHWYIAQRDPKYLRRNALIAVGNSQEKENEKFKSLLEKYLSNPDPLLRSHAVWAAVHLGHQDLLHIVKDDFDQLVLDEIMLAEAEGYL